MIADAICYPTDGNKNFFWNVPNKPVKSLATDPAYLGDNENSSTYIWGQPVYLYPTQI